MSMQLLSCQLEDYLDIRRGLGVKLEKAGHLLPQFVAFLDERGQSTVTVEAALAWAVHPTIVQPGRAHERLSMVRGFARYLQAFDPDTEVPPAGLTARRRRPTPYLFSPADIDRLLAATGGLRPALRAATFRTYFGLLAATGMRGCEARRLDHDDVDLDAGVLTIRDSKFGRSRRIPIHPTTVGALADYTRIRRRLGGSGPSVFVSAAGTRLGGQVVGVAFRRCARHVEFALQPGSGPPRPHALRHAFAVTTVAGWYRDGIDVNVAMPLLSAYLGHTSPASTYWYLQAVPELLTAAAARLEPADRSGS